MQKFLDIPFVYSSNGDSFYEHDRTCTDGKMEQELNLDEFPSPETLWQRYKKYKGITTEEQERITTNKTHAEQLMQVVLKEAFQPAGQASIVQDAQPTQQAAIHA